ncbi:MULTISPECIES: quaternary ammonium compound efflux SMR transporter SugE [Planococcus]|uniref:Ligand-binding protein SH3 n=1 Tax=Planococcus faecalis TaxID=1598147 RepID=A0ABN4XJZ2_9BACL|nr:MULTISPECIES: quaternary ammonium compound efflux SMR transporter SugE [Planococcus]AQU78272.1 ligand-binding protein SH3 [Planococcus faecalis]MDJ0332841.1 quaternary ammonium compound efflux SMR transporter SugE [Planococcus sp. S3-L1]OHX53840.1 ligand-binding protein SH3 [Planococcus faecalis]
MAWIYLMIAGITEILWAIGLKFAEGFTNLVPSLITFVFIVISFMLFAIAMKTIPIGTAYAVFTGIGAAGTAILGIVLFNENASLEKLFFLSLLLVGIIGLKVLDGKETSSKGVQS